MGESAERGKAGYMVGDKYRHRFYLLSDEVITAYSNSKDLEHLSFGTETVFLASDDEKNYTIPFFSVCYIETEEIEN